MTIASKTKYMLIYALFNFGTYFLIQSLVNHQYDLMTPLDSIIPIIPEFVWVYHSFIPVIFATMFMAVKTEYTFKRIFWSFILATIVLNFFYVFFPSEYPRPEFEVDSLSSYLTFLTHVIDKPVNSFPSGHVTMSCLLFFGSRDTILGKNQLWIRLTYGIWALLIAVSTLVLKQHYIVDVFSGFVLALLCYWITGKIWNKTK